jgi:hypothetical protein
MLGFYGQPTASSTETHAPTSLRGLKKWVERDEA